MHTDEPHVTCDVAGNVYDAAIIERVDNSGSFPALEPAMDAHETEKDQLIAVLKAQLKEMEEKNRQELEKNDVQLQEMLCKADEHK